ncbi:metallophosphoesterase [Bordetella genomosp. 5]|uniref:metallophosphoesterase n=1 Tax=Bordetella genomosp. 5 TaxID=1395608 RepID=UPI000B9DF230|nr:metallophosphoesterase [Bordetella genomosp. 5]OZI47770.1 metallophosphoesterase [Bordetella genomosp. 5]
MRSDNSRVQHFRLNTQGRDFAVGDIHGHFGRLSYALAAIKFSPERDRLFSVGDLVDRGPESRDALSWLEQPWFHAICGNHDLMTWRRAMRNPIPDIDHLAHGGQWLDACDGDAQVRIAASLQNLPLAIEVETPSGIVGLVHADFPYDDWQAIHSATFSPEDEDACLWSIDRYRMQYAQPVRNVRALVHGHMTLHKPTQLGNVYYIDTGGWQDGGRFTLLDLHTLKPW